MTLLVGPEQLRIAWKPEQPAALALHVCAGWGPSCPPMVRPAAAGLLGARPSLASCWEERSKREGGVSISKSAKPAHGSIPGGPPGAREGV